MLKRIVAVDLVTAVVLTAGVVLGGWWWAASALAWLAALTLAVVSSPAPSLRDRARSSAGLTAVVGMPLASALGVLATRRSRLESGVVVAALAIGGLAATWAVLLPTASLAWRTRVAPASAARRRPLVAVVVVAVGATVAAAVPVGADTVVGRRLAERVARCPAMQRFAGGDAALGLRRELAAACDLQGGAGPATSSRGGDVDLTFFRPRSDLDPRGAELAASALAHHREVLGPSAVTSVSVLPIGLSGSTRGLAGPGYVLVHPAELVDPELCASFRRTAGVDGRCGAWVLAHELAHQWFRWTSYVQARSALPVLIEGTADYLAYSWWRATYGTEDADRLALELFDGRLGLARRFATVNVPVTPPRGMTDAEGRALVYGRPSAAWVAVEQAVGEAATRRALRAVHEAGRGANPTIDGVLDAVAAAVPAAAPVLRQWWLDPDFEPHL